MSIGRTFLKLNMLPSAPPGFKGGTMLVSYSKDAKNNLNSIVFDMNMWDKQMLESLILT